MDLEGIVPLDLAIIKDDIGMPADDTTDDAWLQRRIDATLAAFRTYTHRWLYPLSEFTDDWTPIPFERWALRFPPGDAGTRWGVSNFLREFPVKEITECKLIDGSLIPVNEILFNWRSGELTGMTVDAQWWSQRPVSQQLPIIKYKAGFETFPPDLYECLIGILTSLWAARSTQKSGVGINGMLPDQVTVNDVGTVKLSGSAYTGSVFADAKSAAADPLLGPFTTTLDSYRDWRNIVAAFGRPITTQGASDPAVTGASNAQPG